MDNHYFVIYDNAYPMAAYWSRKFIVDHASDICDNLWNVTVFYSAHDTVGHLPESESELLLAAVEVLKQHYGLFNIYCETDTGEWVWDCTEHGIFDQCKTLLERIDPQYAATELGE